MGAVRQYKFIPTDCPSVYRFIPTDCLSPLRGCGVVSTNWQGEGEGDAPGKVETREMAWLQVNGHHHEEPGELTSSDCCNFSRPEHPNSNVQKR